MLALFAGVLFAPYSAEASFLSSLFGKDATASDVEALTSTSPVDNSQTLSLLQANSSSLPILKEENNKKIEEALPFGFGPSIISGNALLATADPADILSEGDESAPSFDQISVYVVRKGDSLSKIAEMFEVSINTILWANDLTRKSTIQEGDVLLILPIDGIQHEVKKGETIKSIAKKYKVEVSDIASFNNLAEDAKLAVGDELIIPDGEIYVENETTTKPTSPSKTTPSKTPKAPTRNLAGYYINPAPDAVKTQGVHGKNGIDLGAPIGTPLYAAASGKVLTAKMGWNGAYGNMVIIDHPNGTQTLYAHMHKISVSTGQYVSQGDVIGTIGNSGRVRGIIGAHVHFEVRGGVKNPGVDGSWKR